VERDRDRGQPLTGIRGWIAGGTGEHASRAVFYRAETAHRWPDIPGCLPARSVEHDLGLELPAGAQVLFQQVHVVQVPGSTELLAASGD
jgi:hypothetical protein